MRRVDAIGPVIQMVDIIASWGSAGGFCRGSARFGAKKLAISGLLVVLLGTRCPVCLLDVDTDRVGAWFGLQ